MKITVENEDGNTIVLTFPEDTDIFGWAEQFKTILFWATFVPETIGMIFNNEEEISDNTN